MEQVTVDGESVNAPRVLSPNEVAVLAGITVAPSMLRAYGASAIVAQEDLNEAVANEPGALGMINELFSQRGEANRDRIVEGFESEPWMDPFALMGAGGAMAWMAAEGIDQARQSLDSSAEQTQQQTDQLRRLYSQLCPAGIEIVADVDHTLDSCDDPTDFRGEPAGHVHAGEIRGLVDADSIPGQPGWRVVHRHAAPSLLIGST